MSSITSRALDDGSNLSRRELTTAVAIVTGANRGFGRHLATQLLERGAKVYAAVRDPSSVDLPGAVPLRLDVTDPVSIAEAAVTAADATLLVNNAGISTNESLIDGDLAGIRRDMETNYFGPLLLTREFAPVLTANGGGAVLNVLSVLSWLHPGPAGSYSAAKAAAWALSNATRELLAPSGVTVTGLHVGYMDTDMAAGVPADRKSDPAVVARLALDAVERGDAEVLGDELSRQVRSGTPGLRNVTEG
ncbi:MAG TPA: SDR family oxidoreductase [Actinoplanes sp.]|nr:SDR family oxidoreductase [Actinoplanes sp.]